VRNRELSLAIRRAIAHTGMVASEQYWHLGRSEIRASDAERVVAFLR
jgi:hypothetical protein